MPTLPTKFDLPDPQAVGPVGTARPTGGEALGRGVAKLGEAGEGIAEAEQKKQDSLDMLAWQAKVVPEREKLVDSFRERNDYHQFEPDFTKSIQGINEDALGVVRNPVLRQRLALQGEIDSRGALRRVLSHGSVLRKQDEYAKTDDAMAQTASAAMSPNATPDDVADALKHTQAAADVALNGGVLDYAQRHHLIDKHITGINGVLKRAAENRLWSDPYGTLTDLGVAGTARARQDGEALEPTLIQRESGGKADKVNKDGYAGLYQFGAPRLADLGLYSAGKEEKLGKDAGKGGWGGVKWSGSFHIPGFEDVKTVDDFLANPDAQKAAYRQQIARADIEVKNAGLDKYVGRTIAGVPITEDGLRAMIHLGGVESTKRALASNGRDNPADRNGTSVLDYAKMGVGTKPETADATEPMEGERVPAMPDKGSPWADIYSRMSPIARAHLITNARTALHATLQQDLKDGEAYAERTGELPIDADGKTVRDRMARILTPNQVSKGNLALDAAVGRYKAVAGLSDLDDAQAEKHIRSLAPEEEAKTGLPYAIAAKNQAYAAKAYQKITDLRSKDPGQAAMGGPVNVAGVPKVTAGPDGQLAIDEGDTGNIRTRPAREVQDAIHILNGQVPNLQLTQNEDGSVTAGPAADPQARIKAIGVVLDARLAAQKRWGIPTADQRALRLQEAQSLLDMRNASSLSADEFQTKITEAQQRAKDAYGPYAGRALSDAVKLIVKDRQNKETGLDLAAQLITGRIDADTLMQQRGARAFDDRWWKSGKPSLPSAESGQRAQEMIHATEPATFDPWMSGLRTPGVGPAREAPMTAQPAMPEDMAAPGVSVGYAEPTDTQIEWLKKKGDAQARTVFDSKFGPGAAKKYLGQPAAQ